MKNFLWSFIILLVVISCDTYDTKIKPFEKYTAKITKSTDSVAESLYDTTFINELKGYFFNETGFVLQGKFYTDTATKDDSLYILSISMPDRVESPSEFDRKVSSLMKYLMKYYPVNPGDLKREPGHWKDNDFSRINGEYLKYIKKGYHVAVFNGNVNSATLLTKDLSQSKEILSIIVFHELMHNYLYQQVKIKFSNYYNEAICSVMGNYLALKFASEKNLTDITNIKNEISETEKIYKSINDYTYRINNDSANVEKLLNEFRKERDSILAISDTVQSSRYKGKINNSYLLFNGLYSKRYFEMKELYMKHTDTKEFLKVIKRFLLSGRDYTCFL